MVTTPDDPLDPKRWTARGGDGGAITGDEYAYRKDLVHRRMGVGPTEPEPAPVPPPSGLLQRITVRLRRRT